MLKSFILPKKRGNHSTTAKRSEDGRKGRGGRCLLGQEHR
jgi:hypothetical protein